MLESIGGDRVSTAPISRILLEDSLISHSGWDLLAFGAKCPENPDGWLNEMLDRIFTIEAGLYIRKCRKLRNFLPGVVKKCVPSKTERSMKQDEYIKIPL